MMSSKETTTLWGSGEPVPAEISAGSTRRTLMKEVPMRSTRALVIAALSLAVAIPTSAQVQAGVPLDPGARLALDPSVKTGVLDNGIRYFIKANHFPLKRAELRLAVNAGAVLEEPDQVGL